MLLCEQLPITINEIVNEHNNVTVEKYTAIEELRKIDSNLLKALFLSASKHMKVSMNLLSGTR